MAQNQSPIDPIRWQRAVEIFERVLDTLPDARERLIRDETGGDSVLEETVRGMLSADDATHELLDHGIDEVAHLATRPAHDDIAGLSPGEKVGDFEIIAELGRGGMGIVYSARDTRLGRIAALKLLPHRIAADLRASDLLIAEAKAASALDHPNVATIYQVGETEDGRRFIAMARYEGETLRQRLVRGAISPPEAFDIARQVAAGLAAAHAAGLVHRDVKPENIFLTRQGVPKLLDFGIATLAGSPRDGPTTRGTILYMSPEHARREPADTRSDVWSLGVVLYEMLAGMPPYTSGTPAEILGRIADPAPVRLPQIIRRLPAPQIATLSRALEKKPERRYADASAFAAQLAKVDRPASASTKIQIAGALVAAILLVALGLFTRSRNNVVPNREIPTLAVVPVAGDSSDKQSMDLASALSNEIAARVVGLGRVRLASFRKDSDNRGVHLLRLSMQHSGDADAVEISLEQGETHRPLWKARRAFDRKELRELGRDVVIGVLQALGQPLTERERALIGNAFPSSAQAYEDFLKANQLLAVRTPAALESALVLYRHASRLDTMFAAALARQSYAYSLLMDWGWKPTQLFPADPMGEAMTLADRATRIDSTGADAWLARAYILALRDPRRMSGAVEAFQRAITLDPYNPEAFHQYGQTLMALGRYTESLAAYRRVLDLEPDRAMTFVPVAAIHQREGRLSEALRLMDSAISASPRVPYARATRSIMRSLAGDYQGAKADAEFALTLDSTYRIPALSALSKALWMLGDKSAALVRLADAEKALVNSTSPTAAEAFWLSIAEVATGRQDRAVMLLRNARPQGAFLWFYFQDSGMAEFRKRPDVAAMLHAVDPRRSSS